MSTINSEFCHANSLCTACLVERPFDRMSSLWLIFFVLNIITMVIHWLLAESIDLSKSDGDLISFALSISFTRIYVDVGKSGSTFSVLVFSFWVTNYHQLSRFKQHNVLSHSVHASGVWAQDSTILCWRPHRMKWRHRQWSWPLQRLLVFFQAHGLLAEFGSQQDWEFYLLAGCQLGATLRSGRQWPFPTMWHSLRHGSLFLPGQQNSLVLKGTTNMFYFLFFQIIFRSHSSCVLLLSSTFIPCLVFKRICNSLINM